MSEITYLWRPARDYPERLIVSPDEDCFDQSRFRLAVAVDSTKPPRFISGEPIVHFQKMDYIPNLAQLPLISASATEAVMELCPNDIQLVGATIVCSDGEMECFVVNPLTAVAAVDWELSKHVNIPGTEEVMLFKRLELRPNALGECHIARLKEFPPYVLVSEAFKAIFSGCSLCRFVLPSTIR